jgi:7-keto-8-aminopelargonate synthetase-like enzyme
VLPNKNYKKFENYQQNDLMRNIIEIKNNTGRIINSKLINFSSNDYLGISKSDRLKRHIKLSSAT